MSNNPIAIDASDLQYYDKQIKKYIDDKDAELKASLSTFDEIEEIVNKLSEDVAVLLDDRDEAEINISRLQDMDSAILGELGNIKDTKLDESVMEYLATKEFVKAEIANAELSGKEIDLTNYYTKAEVDAKIPSLVGYATEDYVKAKIAEDVSDFVTNTDLDSKGFVTEDILSENYATNKFVNESIASVNEKINQITVPTKISELDNDANYATEQYVLDHVSEQIETEVETQVTQVVQTQVKDEIARQLAENEVIKYGEW